jgi:hypothetical protein
MTSMSNHRVESGVAGSTLASLKLPTKVSGLATYAQQIVTSMTGNPAFASPVPTLAEVTAATTFP